MQKPIFITNFKNYPQSAGENAIFLAKIHEKIAKKYHINIAVAVGALDLMSVIDSVDIPVFSQHLCQKDMGSTTGSVVLDRVKALGASGSLLNHSEKRVSDAHRKKIITKAREQNFPIFLCAESPEEVKEFSRKFSPDFIAFEPPELIGSTDASVASSQPESMKQSIKNAGNIPLLVGAGIASAKDIEVSLSLGAQGFLVASSIVKAHDPEKALLQILQPLM